MSPTYRPKPKSTNCRPSDTLAFRVAWKTTKCAKRKSIDWVILPKFPIWNWTSVITWISMIKSVTKQQKDGATIQFTHASENHENAFLTYQRSTDLDERVDEKRPSWLDQRQLVPSRPWSPEECICQSCCYQTRRRMSRKNRHPQNWLCQMISNEISRWEGVRRVERIVIPKTGFVR